jgi:hypothetical protein
MAFTLGGSLGLVTLGLVAREAGIPVAWTIAAAIHVLVAVGIVVGGRALAASPSPSQTPARTAAAPSPPSGGAAA